MKQYILEIAEKEIIKETKEFAKINNIHYDELTESMILNAMRELNKCFIANVVVPKGTFCECEAPLIRTGNNTNGYCGSCGKDLNWQNALQRLLYE